MNDEEKRILAEGTVMAARIGTIESATEYILRHDEIIEGRGKMAVLFEIRGMIELQNPEHESIARYIDESIEAIEKEMAIRVNGNIDKDGELNA